MKPLAIDLFCGLGGWTEGLLAEGYRVVGFDIEQHQYGAARYPSQLVLQDVLTLHGAQFKDAALIVASPPCQAYSYRAMPWKRAKALPPPDNTLFEACFRIQREAEAAAGHLIPLVVENVCGAQKWVGRARWHSGPYYFWGDVPALMPIRIGKMWMKGRPIRKNGNRTNTFCSDGGDKQQAALIAKIPIRNSSTHCSCVASMKPAGAKKRRDLTEPDILVALRQVGADYLLLDTFDVLVLFRGQLIMLDCKSMHGKPTDSQQALIARGWPLRYAVTPDDALRAIGALPDVI